MTDIPDNEIEAAWEAWLEDDSHDDKVALRAALTAAAAVRAPVQKPRAWIIGGDDDANCNGFIDAMAYQHGEFNVPLFAEPAAAVRAPVWTDEQVEKAARAICMCDWNIAFDSDGISDMEREAYRSAARAALSTVQLAPVQEAVGETPCPNPGAYDNGDCCGFPMGICIKSAAPSPPEPQR